MATCDTLKYMYMGVWRVLGEVITEPESLVCRENLLFTRCPECTDVITWRPFKTRLAFSGTCCAYVFLARPTTMGAHTFRVNCGDVDMTNITVMTAVEK